MILITGATGLVGSHLALYLLESRKIDGQMLRAIYRKADSIEKTKSLFRLYHKEDLFEKIEWLQADITEIPSLDKAFQNIDYVYHCAASVSFDSADEDILRKTNIEGTANVVNFCLQYNVMKLCYVSSIAALGDLKGNETVINEETDWNPEKPHSDYAISKYGAEMEIFRGQQEGLQSVIVNPGVILGPGFWNTSSGEIFSRVANGLFFYTKGTTGFVCIDDVVRIMVELMERESSGERFILIAENLSFANILNTTADALKVKRPAIYGKPWLTEIGWRFDWLMAVILNKKRKLPKSLARSLHQTDIISNGKIKKELRYDFVDIHACIGKIAALYKSIELN